MADELDSVIEQNASAPRRASGDAGSVEQHSLQDQIAVDRYLASKRAARRDNLGIRLFRIKPSGAV